MSTKPLARYRHAALAVAALTLALTGCQGDGNEADGDPTEVPSTSTATPTETTADTSWREEYDEEQLQAYEAALQRFTDYEQTSEPIWRDGRATPEAEALFASYWVDNGAQQLALLQSYQQNGVQISGLPTVVDSRATYVAETAESGSVTIDQCLDYSTSTVTQRGESVPTPDAVVDLQLRTVEMGRVPDNSGDLGQWRIVYINTYDGTEPC